MKTILGFVAAMTLTVSAFADLSKEQMRVKIASSTEVKAISEAYKSQGYKCQNTTIIAAQDDLVNAQKVCIYKDKYGESAKIMLIKANVTSDSVTILNIEFMLAG